MFIFVENHMELNAFSSQYFPPIRFFADFLSQENPCIDVYENYQKQTYRNRCHILSPNGLQKLVVPIAHTGKRAMKDLQISYAQDWQKEHLRSFEAAYRRSPYFEYYEDDLMPTFEKKHKFLLDLNLEILEQLLNLLQIENKFSLSESYIESPAEDFRQAYDAKNPVEDLPEYTQVFSEKLQFIPDLSVVDLLFNEGPKSIVYLKNLKQQ
ncbi:WbqC family protein [Ornithobacterium rhinotracheale]